MKEIKRLKILFLFIVMAVAFNLLGYSNEAFDALSSILVKKLSPAERYKMEAEYKGENVNGFGYVINVSMDISGNFIVHLSTDKNPRAHRAVNVAVIVSPTFDKAVSELKEGEQALFHGDFKEIRMNTIVLEDGFVD